MNSSKQKVYYHGTDPRFLFSIMNTGFNLEETIHGRMSGNGIYLATKPESAIYWASPGGVHRHYYAIKVNLQPGVKILWKERNYNKRIIRSLEKKFTKKVSCNYDFWKYIPSNKQLTSNELRALISHLDIIELSLEWHRKRYKFLDKKNKHLSRFNKLIRQYGYDAIGDRTQNDWDSDEIIVFNPSLVIPLSVHQLDFKWDTKQDVPQYVIYSAPLPLTRVQTISSDELEDYRRWESEYEAELQ